MTSAITQALSSALLHFVWQGLVAALLLWVALMVMRNRSAQARYAASCLALVLLLAMPVITAGVLFRAPAAIQSVEPGVPAPPPAAVSSNTAASSWRLLAAWQSWILPVWSAGVLLFSLRLVWGCCQVSSLRRQGTPPDETILAIVSRLEDRLDLTRRVRVLITSAADGPSVVGWIRPVILMPSATLLGLTTEQLEAVLAHELAHVRRHDYLVNLAQTVVESLLFYHPAVWWISARIRHERELCCDDLAVTSCGDALCYARALTRLEKLRATPRLAMAGTGGPLLYRIQRLVGAHTTEYAPSKLSGILAVTLGIACLALNVHWARAQSLDEPKTDKLFAFALTRSQERDGAGVAVNLNGAGVLHRSSIEYPHQAMEKGIQGPVTVEAVLEADGSVADARVLSGPSELRRTVLQSVLEWHFAPASAAGSSRQVTVNFDLDAAQKHHAEEHEDVLVKRLELTRDNDIVLVSRNRQMEELHQQVRELEEHLDREKSNVEAVRSLQAQLEEARSRLEAQLSEPSADHEVRIRSSFSPVDAIGHRLAQIDAIGFSDEVRQSLLSRIPVRIGETLSEHSIERITAALATFDQHNDFKPRWTMVPLDSGEIALRIIAPNSEDEVKTFRLRQ